MIESREATAVPVAAQEPAKIKSAKRTLTFSVLLPIFSILFTFLLLEGGVRLAIALEIPYFRDPALYTYPFEDDYWKLSYRWVPGATDGASEKLNTDPLLGWTPPTSPQNPLGLMSHQPYEVNPAEPAILFYGDSFVAGKTAAPDDNIPNQLAAHLGQTAVYNYGVSNYGVDQIYLRFRETHAAFAQPTVIIGIFTLDLDRSLITLRSSAPKPYFTIGENDALRLHGIDGVPLNNGNSAWIAGWNEQNPPQIVSYAWKLLTRRVDSMRTGNNWLASSLPQEKIERLNGLIIAEMAREAQQRDLPLTFVIFYTRPEMDQAFWRETFLRQQLDSLGVPYLDTKPLLIETAQAEGRDLWDYYFADGGHTNELGNAVIAEALAGMIDGSNE